MDVSIIFVNYRTSKILIEAISSVIAHTKDLSYEIIIVDNNSQDDSEKELKDCFGEQIQYIQLPENVGFGRANNEGLQIAQGRNILFLNPDILLINNAVYILCSYLDTHNETGAVGGNLYTTDKKPNFSYNKIRPSILDEIDQAFSRILSRILFGHNARFNYTQHVIEVDFISGADLMIPKHILDNIGAFDPQFFMYYEDSELCWRIKKLGKKVINIPTAQIIHLEGKSYKTNLRRERNALESRKLYFEKTYPGFYVYIANIVYIILLYIAIQIYRWTHNEIKYQKIKQRLNLFKEIY